MDLAALVNHLITIILMLYGDCCLPRNIVDRVIRYFNNYICTYFLPSLKNDVLEILQNDKNVSQKTYIRINSIFSRYDRVFDKVNSEQKIFGLLERVGFEKPDMKVVGSKMISELENDSEKAEFEPIECVWIPLRKSLKIFLEIPGIFQEIINYITKLSIVDNIISNLTQGSLWKSMKIVNTIGQVTLPLYVFYDELETGNALGSHASTNKFGATYAEIGALPPKIAARLDSILFCSLINAKDKSEAENNEVFDDLIKELNFLATHGIQINVQGRNYNVKFRLVLIVGDNLGLNQILGFVDCFNSDYFCRICKVTAEECHKLVSEDVSKLRNLENYETDVKEKNSLMTGIKEPCCFNGVNYYHVTKNVFLDVLHDYLEGVCTYTLHALIKTFTKDKKYNISLHVLNLLIQDFDYGDSPKPPKIAFARLQQHNTLKMSAAEILSLVRYLPIILGPVVPRYDEHWKLLLLLRRIGDILTNHRIIKADIGRLSELITEFNTLYIRFYGDLKPKFHHLVHYPRLLELNGPCFKYSTMRFESRHRRAKQSAGSSSCTKNLLYTIAIKETLKTCQTIHNAMFPSPAIHVPNIISEDKAEKYYESVEIEGTMFKIGKFVVADIQNEVSFGEILQIIRVQDVYYFSMNIYEECSFDSHLHAYIVVYSKSIKMSSKDLPYISSVLSVKHEELHYIVAPYGL
ncbi:hypothetical protein TKK_0013383 [Trichogramma kaykai]